MRLKYLDGIRALAALYVCIGHALLEIWPQPGNLHGITLLVVGPLRYGHSAVGMFIVLSGFCLMLPVVKSGGVLNRSVTTFYINRCRRILPTFYTALVFSTLMATTVISTKTGSHFDESLPVTPRGFIANALLVQNVFSSGKINGAFWSIAVEWQIYFLFPLLVILFKRAAVLTTLLAVGAALTLSLLLKGTMWAGITPQYLALFCFGMLACKLVAGGVSRPGMWMAASIGSFVALAATLYLWRRDLSGMRLVYSDLICGIWASSLLIWVSVNASNPIRRVAEIKPLVYFGSISYSFYLIHTPLMHLIWEYVFRPMHASQLATFTMLVGGGLPITIAVAIVFFRLFENPFIKAAPRKVAGEQAGPRFAFVGLDLRSTWRAMNPFAGAAAA